MIRYAVTGGDLRERVDAFAPGWRTKATTRTAALVKAKKFNESASIWSEIKPVFMEVQANKCIFCERRFEDQTYGRIEHDLEHFRPKGNVKAWTTTSPELGANFVSGDPSDTGYYWLAYNLENYAAACKVCNSAFKSDYFPIAAARGKHPATIAGLRKSEKPYLCLPIGAGDADPEELLEFVGTVVKPRAATGHKRLRGQVIIDFFLLNDRDVLHIERAEKIMLLGASLEKIDAGAQVERWTRLRDALVSDASPHAACCRAFLKRWADDQSGAKKLLEAARDIIIARAAP